MHTRTLRTVSLAVGFAHGDIRATIPRFNVVNRDANQALVDRNACGNGQNNLRLGGPGRPLTGGKGHSEHGLLTLPKSRPLPHFDELGVTVEILIHGRKGEQIGADLTLVKMSVQAYSFQGGPIRARRRSTCVSADSIK